MTTPFDRPLAGYRFVQTEHGDTLQKVAARYLGDASLWTEIIVLNQMVPPYLTDDPSAATAGVFLNGSYITIPASAPGASTSDPAAVFGRDILLTGGVLTVVNGDLALVDGVDNLNQALQNLLQTDQGELLFHQDYGTLIRMLIGTKNGPTAALLAAEYAKDPIAADPRISDVSGATGIPVGDGLQVVVQAVTVQGAPTSTSVTF
jgi:phage baseplate assembly protein W